MHYEIHAQIVSTSLDSLLGKATDKSVCTRQKISRRLCGDFLIPRVNKGEENVELCTCTRGL